ncbi:MAG TPA: hypothetical protein VJH97_04965 [Candidatus Nanoarchaeia archaeon]|nr:hypothetical protein [Candidatus Nanoarchaeia archaeon]
MPVLESRNQRISLSNEVRKVSYDSRADLAPLFPVGQETPILWGHDSHPYLNLYRVRGPVDITEEGAFVEAASSHKVQVCWTQWPQPGDSREPKPYPSNHGEGRRISIVTKHMEPAEAYLIIGPEDCRRQLEQWGISGSGIDELL